MILALVEHKDGAVSEASLQALTYARTLGAVEAVAVGSDGSLTKPQLGAFGIETLHLITHPQLDRYAPSAWANGLATLASQTGATVIIAAGSDRGNEVMAHVGAAMDLPMASNCTQVSDTGDHFEITRIRWGGSLLEEAILEGDPKLLTILPRAIEAEPTQSVSTQVVERPVDLMPENFLVQVSATEKKAGGISLHTARVVVSGGRGVGSAEGFAILEELAALLGGAIGCSRVVTNNGWRPHADQVGQTGARVAPELYIACGISGAIQHWVGCKAAKKVLVINTDADAPLVSRADYAVIADLHDIVPAISEAIRGLEGRG